MQNEKIIKLTKTETNELLKKITEEEQKFGLILLLQYIYGRNVSEVYNLQKKDINLEENKITFIMNGDKLTYNIHPQIKYLLKKITEENKGYIFQEGERPLSTIKDGINYYLHRKTEKINSLPFMEGLRLTTKDFKTLRGQHLFQEGISIKTIHELYHNTNMDGTKRTIKYEELKKELYPEDIEAIIENTFLSVYQEHEFNNNPIYYVTNTEDKEAILEVGEELKYYGDEELKEKVADFDNEQLLNKIKYAEKPGEYVYYKGLKFLRN